MDKLDKKQITNKYTAMQDLEELETKTKKSPFKRGGTACAAIKCYNRRHNSDISLFRFPKQEERYK